jgi:ESCRT-II complex subunit VPS36
LILYLRDKIFQTPIHPSPPRSYKGHDDNKDSKSDSIPIDSKNDDDSHWKCDTCSTKNSSIDLKCKGCGVRKIIEDWNCNDCGSPNPFYGTNCQVCNSDRIHDQQKTVCCKLSFKGSGFSNFLAHFQVVMTKQEWKQIEQQYMCSKQASRGTNLLHPSERQQAFGIAGIIRKKEELLAQSQTQINEAFKDLDSLMLQATEMVNLAQSLKNKLDNQKGNTTLSLSSPEERELRELLLEIGIVGSFTKETAAGNLYYQELAKELAEFTLRLFSIKTLKIIPLTDVYCLFNKARGAAFVSPKDLKLSAEIMGQLGMPVTLRRLRKGSGEIILQSKDLKIENMAKSVKELIDKKGGHFGIDDFSQTQNLSISLCTELLEEVEMAGYICRDQSLYGIVYYPNMINDPSLMITS